MLYVEVLNAINGMIESALCWYELYTVSLKEVGFKRHIYNKCLTNNMKNVSQCTVGLFVDDNRIFHVDDNVNTGTN